MVDGVNIDDYFSDDEFNKCGIPTKDVIKLMWKGYERYLYIHTSREGEEDERGTGEKNLTSI
jgi:hypothetical protein